MFRKVSFTSNDNQSDHAYCQKLKINVLHPLITFEKDTADRLYGIEITDKSIFNGVPVRKDTNNKGTIFHLLACLQLVLGYSNQHLIVLISLQFNNYFTPDFFLISTY